MMDLELDLVRAGSAVVHEAPEDVTDRVSAAMVDAVNRHYGVAWAAGAHDAVDGPATRGRWRNGVRVAAAVLVGAAVLAGAVVLAANHRQTGPAGGTTAAATSSPETTTAEDAVTIVPADPAGASRVAVSGASPQQLATIRDVIAGLGPGPVIASVTLDERGPKDVKHRNGQRELIVVGARSDQVGVWLAHAAADELVARLNRGGDAITWLGYADGGNSIEGLTPTGVGAGPAPALAAGRASLDSAKAAGYRAEVTVYPIGAVATVLHLEEPEYFAPHRTDWLHVAGGFDDSTTHRLVAVEAPDGTRIFTSGYGTCYDCSAAHAGPTPGTPLPATMAGPTVLAVGLSSPLGTRPDVRIDIDCTTNGAPAALCDAIARDRYALFQPQVSDTTCAGGLIGSANVTIRGTLGGIPIDTGYGGCTAGAAQRWLDVLRAARQLTGAWTTDD